MSAPSTSRRPFAWLNKMVIAALVVLALVWYVVGYIAWGDSGPYHNRHDHRFSSKYFVFAYYPMGWIECRLSHEQVWLSAPGRSISFDPP